MGDIITGYRHAYSAKDAETNQPADIINPLTNQPILLIR
jgi:hypothetical protein